MRKHINSLIKLLIIYVLRILMNILYICPIKQNRIVFNSYRGQQYSCSPKFISEALIKFYPGEFDIIWAFNEPDKFYFLKNQGIKIVKYSSLKRFYYEATAKISINNIGSYSWMPIRKGQEHVNTWHGAVDYKKVALSEINNDRVMKKTLLMTAKETSLYLSANRFFSEYCLPVEFGYHGPILEKGLPRNDDLFLGENIEIEQKIRKLYHIPKENIVVLYAPTWRYDVNNEIQPLDIELVIKSVESRFKSKCTIIYRAHHITGCKYSELPYVINVTDYPDSQEILMVSNIMITDYSSMIWDFSLTYRPVFLFVPDLEAYSAARGFNIPIEKWGFALCQSNEVLANEIMNYNEKDYRKVVKKHHDLLQSFETGHASENVCEWIYAKCYK